MFSNFLIGNLVAVLSLWGECCWLLSICGESWAVQGNARSFCPARSLENHWSLELEATLKTFLYCQGSVILPHQPHLLYSGCLLLLGFLSIHLFLKVLSPQPELPSPSLSLAKSFWLKNIHAGHHLLTLGAGGCWRFHVLLAGPESYSLCVLSMGSSWHGYPVSLCETSTGTGQMLSYKCPCCSHCVPVLF